jgi:ATP-dependent helicase/DNAse subunit B
MQVEIGWPSWNNLLRYWENKLNPLAEGFTKGQIQINPIKKNETCRNCGYSMLCRITEHTSNENNLEN